MMTVLAAARPVLVALTVEMNDCPRYAVDGFGCGLASVIFGKAGVTTEAAGLTLW